MGDLTENEIMDCLRDNLRKAIQDCLTLARVPNQGPAYVRLRDEAELIEGACRQVAAWREDTRWLGIAFMIAIAKEKAGTWLRGYKTPNGIKIKLADRHRFEMFNKLADNLRLLMVKVDEYQHKRTGKVGLILPEPQRAVHRETRPHSMSGLILPDGFVAGHA